MLLFLDTERKKLVLGMHLGGEILKVRCHLTSLQSSDSRNVYISLLGDLLARVCFRRGAARDKKVVNRTGENANTSRSNV